MKAEEFESEWKRYCDSKGGGAVTMNLKDVAHHFAKIGYEQAQKDFRWHSIEESLPPYDEEVIALTDMMHGKKLSSASCICYAHRPNPKGYNGKSIITGKVSHYEPMTYNGWNIEGVKYWMSCPSISE